MEQKTVEHRQEDQSSSMPDLDKYKSIRHYASLPPSKTCVTRDREQLERERTDGAIDCDLVAAKRLN